MKNITLALTAVMSVSAFSSPVIDGTLDASYGAAIALQDTQTGFGDSNLGVIDYANGSELDGGYATISGGNLYMMLTGNLESNFNKLEIFVDSVGGGQNVLRGDNANVDFNGLNRLSGLKFDNDFAADFWIGMTGGGGPYTVYANAANLPTGGNGAGGYLGSTGAASNGALSGGSNPDNIQLTLNNSNTAGVSGGGVGNPGAVTTGMEICVPLSVLGNPIGSIKICAFINGGGHDYAANQFLGGVGGASNLGEPHNIDLSNVNGNQYFAVPEPASVTFLALGLLGLAGLKRRKA